MFLNPVILLPGFMSADDMPQTKQTTLGIDQVLV
jgi:hypothetical protein